MKVCRTLHSSSPELDEQREKGKAFICFGSEERERGVKMKGFLQETLFIVV